MAYILEHIISVLIYKFASHSNESKFQNRTAKVLAISEKCNI